jgi:hypothetical protein
MTRTGNGLSAVHTQAGRFQRALVDLYAQHRQQQNGLPTSGRFLFYEGVQVQAWPKHYDGKRRRVDQDVSDALTHLREILRIPWTDIVDETRSLKAWRYGVTVLDYLREAVPVARINPWGDELPPLVLCESRSLAGVLEELLRAYVVPVGATNGQTAGFLHTDVVPLLQEGPRRILYLGDFDWQGGQIEQHTRRVIQRALDGTGEDEDSASWPWQRIALTAEQVRDFRLPVIQKIDHRYTPPKVHDAVETEALSQTVIVWLVRAALDAFLPEPLNDVFVREAQERRAALRRMQRWR